jgi:glycosyltransferase involved in cell wall biosynthesis
MHQTRAPKVSFGLPVFNGGSMVSEVIDSILAQTFRDFELVIFDNASTDSTEATCRDYARRDSRIRYARGHVNRGAQYSHNQVVRLSHGEYFNFAGHDDKFAPRFLERCVEVLDTRPEIVLCFCNFDVIDESGALLWPGTPTPRLLQLNPAHRLRDFWRAPPVSQIDYGLIRRSALEKTELHQDWYGSDRALILDLVLLGGFERLDETLFFSREHKGRSGYQGEGINRNWAPHLRTQSEGYWRRLKHVCRMVRRPHLSRSERIAVFLECLRFASRRFGHWSSHLRRDFAVAVKEIAMAAWRERTEASPPENRCRFSDKSGAHDGL